MVTIVTVIIIVIHPVRPVAQIEILVRAVFLEADYKTRGWYLDMTSSSVAIP